MFDLIPFPERRMLTSFRREMDDLFGPFFASGLFSPSFDEGGFLPSVDVSETEKEFVVHAEVPGMDPKDVDISIHHNVLTMRGERKQERKEEKDGRYHVLERRYGNFSRSFALPVDVEADKVEAYYKDGVLSITIPKAKAEVSKKIEVKAA